MKAVGHDTLKTRSTLELEGRTYHYFSIPAAEAEIGDVSRLPISLKVLLENVLRFEDGRSYTVHDAHSIAAWLTSRGKDEKEIAFRRCRSSRRAS